MSAGRLAELVEALAGRITFELDERDFTVPDRPLTEWLTALTSAAPDAIVPALLGDEDSRHLYDRLTDPWAPLETDVVDEVGRWVTEQVAGRPWWEVSRLARTGIELWNALDGWCMERGLNPKDMDLRRFCNAVFKLAVSSFTEAADRDAWVEWLRSPPNADALAERPEWSDEATAESFNAVFASFGGG